MENITDMIDFIDDDPKITESSTLLSQSDSNKTEKPPTLKSILRPKLENIASMISSNADDTKTTESSALLPESDGNDSEQPLTLKSILRPKLENIANKISSKDDDTKTTESSTVLSESDSNDNEQRLTLKSILRPKLESIANTIMGQDDDTKNTESSTLLSQSGSTKSEQRPPVFKSLISYAEVPPSPRPKSSLLSFPYAKKYKDPTPSTINVLAAQTLKIASINGLGELDKLENELEDEIRYENRSPAKTLIGRLRREGQHKLHSKVVLLVIVFLNIIDCLLVMAELTLDFHHVTQRQEETINMLNEFESDIHTKYNLEEDDHPSEGHHHILLQKILDAQILFNMTSMQRNISQVASGCVRFLNNTAASFKQPLSDYVLAAGQMDSSDWMETSVCFQPLVGINDSLYNDSQTYILQHKGLVGDTLTMVAHKLHYISIAILSVLVIVLALKIICNGARFFKSRMQVFDGIIVLISFVLDFVFIEGVTIQNLQNIVIILTFLFPWRILRVLNSLIVAVLDKQRLNLKILYTQKRKIARTLSETNAKMEVLQRHIEVLQNLCSTRGAISSETDIRRLGTKKNASSTSSQKNGSSGGLAGMMALGKLAFQAADAFTPITEGNAEKSKSNGSVPGRDSGDISLKSSPSKGINVEEITTDGDPCNNNSSNQNHNNGHVVSETTVDLESPEASPEMETASSTDSLESITIHVNGTGPPRERHKLFSLDKQRPSPESGDTRKASISLPDLRDEREFNDTDVISSRL